MLVLRDSELRKFVVTTVMLLSAIDLILIVYVEYVNIIVKIVQWLYSSLFKNVNIMGKTKY